MKKIKIPDRFKIGLIVFTSINIAVKIIEYKIAMIYDVKIAILLIFLFNLFIRFSIILLYDHLKKDWLLIENLKEKLNEKQKVKEHTSFTRKIMRFRKIGKWFLLTGLIFTDPVVTVLYYREGHNLWNFIPQKVLPIFIGSIIICTLTLLLSIYSVMILVSLFI